MPTFDDPRADAAETQAALRGLAHATRAFSDPADTYPVIGDLLAGVRSLRQVLDQLASAHIAHRARAHDDAGNQLAGASSPAPAPPSRPRTSCTRPPPSWTPWNGGWTPPPSTPAASPGTPASARRDAAAMDRLAARLGAPAASGSEPFRADPFSRDPHRPPNRRPPSL